jgi:hypothetical protein
MLATSLHHSMGRWFVPLVMDRWHFVELVKLLGLPGNCTLEKMHLWSNKFNPEQPDWI